MRFIIDGIGIIVFLVGWIAPILGIIALIILSVIGSQISPNIGWAILALLMINFSATSALRKDARENGANNQNPTVKSWIAIGLLARVVVTALSLHVLLNF